jgi:hypothetical protein
MEELEILAVDSIIRKKFEDDYQKIPLHYRRLEEINETLSKNLRMRIRKKILKTKEELIQKIEELENNTQLNFYISETSYLLETYKNLLISPIKLNFMGKQQSNSNVVEKNKITIEYFQLCKKYIDLDIEFPKRKYTIMCSNCQNKKNFEIIDDNIYICDNCNAQQIILKVVSSYRDIDRINISSKYVYDRKIHFRDCINQYQGKQNSSIEQHVYDDLEEQFCRHHLISRDKSIPKEERFATITKEHVSMFLKDLSYAKHYENINLIHYNLTGIKPDDIGYLENILLDDFDILTDLYDKLFKDINRKNFINTQYVLYQLLTRHKHVCNQDDFVILKTMDIKYFHDEICSVLFNILGWNMVPWF